jgi:hypothetical protein
VLRYFVRIDEKIVWADRPEELMEDLLQGQQLPLGIDPPLPMSVTFIPATVWSLPSVVSSRRVVRLTLLFMLSAASISRSARCQCSSCLPSG